MPPAADALSSGLGAPWIVFLIPQVYVFLIPGDQPAGRVPCWEERMEIYPQAVALT